MEIILYFFDGGEKDPPTQRWIVDVPQLITNGWGATREEALKNALKEAFESIAFYLEHGRITPEEAAEVRFIESEEQPSPKELARRTPAWFQEAVRETSKETHAEP